MKELRGGGIRRQQAQDESQPSDRDEEGDIERPPSTPNDDEKDHFADRDRNRTVGPHPLPLEPLPPRGLTIGRLMGRRHGGGQYASRNSSKMEQQVGVR